jgi:hypothetical protein
VGGPPPFGGVACLRLATPESNACGWDAIGRIESQGNARTAAVSSDGSHERPSPPSDTLCWSAGVLSRQCSNELPKRSDEGPGEGCGESDELCALLLVGTNSGSLASRSHIARRAATGRSAESAMCSLTHGR